MIPEINKTSKKKLELTILFGPEVDHTVMTIEMTIVFYLSVMTIGYCYWTIGYNDCLVYQNDDSDCYNYRLLYSYNGYSDWL